MEDITTSRRFLVDAIRERYRNAPNTVMLVGICGGVASGKSRFTAALDRELKQAHGLETIHLPLELWINRPMFVTGVYEDRFFLEELWEGIRALRTGQQWLCPRFDLIKRFKHNPHLEPKELRLESSQVVWNGRSFRQVAVSNGLSDLPGASGVYVESSTQRLFSLFLPRNNVVYLIDGTIVYVEPEIHSFYDHRVYVTAPFAVRIARMTRRYNRAEVYGSTAKSEVEYIKFLVDEARNCADISIAKQLDAATQIVRSASETLSNILDLYYLREGLELRGYAKAYGVSANEIDTVIEQETEMLTQACERTGPEALRSELDHLFESKHLLVLRERDAIIAHLHKTFGR